MSRDPLRVLVVGATGVFGRRLAGQLAREPGIAIVLAGRTGLALKRLQAGLVGQAQTCVLDRDRVAPEALLSLDCAVVIDAAGPFQGSRTALVEAAIAAGCHYFDLADGREFVREIRRFDAAARAAGVAVLSGASSTPALSHAVVDSLTGGWRRIDAIRVAIAPGNRAPRGLAVVRAILSYVGRPVRVYREGRWTQAPGWGLTRRVAIPGVGVRRVSLCETPDLDLLYERYHPQVAAEFLAGLELAVLHRGLEFASLAVRFGLLDSLVPLARPLRLVAALLYPFGSDVGGMLVEVGGQNTDGAPAMARWSLAAEGGRGPDVPTLAALALVRRIRDDTLAHRGAGPCVGVLSLADFADDFARLGIVTSIEFTGQINTLARVF